MTGNTSATFLSAVLGILQTLQTLTWLLSGVAVVVFMFGLVQYVAKASDSKAHQTGKQLMIWGLIALFVIFSLASIIILMCNSLLGSNACSAVTATTSIST